MLKRKNLVLLSTLTALVLSAAVLSPVPAASAAEAPITWVLFDTLKPGKAQQWAGLVTENYGPVLDAMQAEGHVIAWGLAGRASGSPDQPTHVGWVTYTSWSGMAATQEAFDEHFADRPPEDMAAIGQAFSEAVEPHSSIIRHLRGVVLEVAEGGTPPKFIVTANWDPRPGKEKVARQMYEGIRPMFQGLLAEGAITGYGLYEQALHDGGSYFMSWHSLESMAGLDAVDAAFAAMEAEGAEGAQAAIDETFDVSGHRDTLWEVLHFGSGGASE